MLQFWPQLTMIVLYAIGIGIAIAKNGEPKNENHNAFTVILASALGLWILYMGGFFG